MSQFDVAFFLLVSGIAVGWRINVYGMLPIAMLAMFGIYLHGRFGGEAVVPLLLHIVEGLVIFEAAYVLGAMLADARRHLPVDEARVPREHE